MTKMEKLNVVRYAGNEKEKQKLIEQGFKEVPETTEQDFEEVPEKKKRGSGEKS